MMDRIREVVCLALLILPSWSVAQPNQDQLLANQYYSNGEYEKAVGLFEKLFKDHPASHYYYKYYFNCLVHLEEYTDAEKVAKKQLRKNPENLTFHVDLGFIYARQDDRKKAEKEFDAGIAKLIPDRTTISQLANAFISVREFDHALRTYQKGGRLVGDDGFAYEKAMLARMQDDIITMIAHLLDYINYYPDKSERVESILQDEMVDEIVLKELTAQLYKRIQSNPDDVIYTELLTWVFIQKRDFAGALRQVKALDRRLREKGRRVNELATALMNELAYDEAAAAYQYLVDQGKNGPFYFYGREGLLRARKAKITANFNYTQEDLLELKDDYETFIDEFGFNKAQAAPTLRELAQLEAFYLHNTTRAIEILEDLLDAPGMTIQFKAGSKLDLGDAYLISGDIWESTLLYSQVDKQMKDDPLGEDARFRNARLSYFRGEFLWAQGQLDVLKASTSELIANDALNLSVFITDHLGLDTTSQPMMMFARADLYAFQNKHKEAFATMDSLEERFSGHSLLDDIYMLKSEVHLKKQEVDLALGFLKKIAEGHPGSILIDDALFLLGDLYENALNEPELAMGYFEQIILDHKGSVFVVEARDRFRALRGDKLN